MAQDDDMQTFRRKAVTNGDRIRSLTDEELANQYVDAVCHMHTDCQSINCVECALNWLRQEVREDAGTMTKQDAIETLEIFRNDYTREDSAICRAINIAIDALRQHTIEPEVRHGRWITKDSKTAKCSCCGWWQRAKTYYLPDDIHAFSKCYRFCTSCGVQMDGGADND